MCVHLEGIDHYYMHLCFIKPLQNLTTKIQLRLQKSSSPPLIDYIGESFFGCLVNLFIIVCLYNTLALLRFNRSQHRTFDKVSSLLEN